MYQHQYINHKWTRPKHSTFVRGTGAAKVPLTRPAQWPAPTKALSALHETPQLKTKSAALPPHRPAHHACSPILSLPHSPPHPFMATRGLCHQQSMLEDVPPLGPSIPHTPLCDTGTKRARTSLEEKIKVCERPDRLGSATNPEMSELGLPGLESSMTDKLWNR